MAVLVAAEPAEAGRKEAITVTRLDQLLVFKAEDPTDAFISFALAMEYRKLGDLSKARQVLEELMATDSAYIGTYFHLGKICEQLGDKDAARNIFTTGIQISAGQNDHHAKSELQGALMELDGIGFD